MPFGLQRKGNTAPICTLLPVVNKADCFQHRSMNHSLGEVNPDEQHSSLSFKTKLTRMGSFKNALETASLGKVGALEVSLHVTVSNKPQYLPHTETKQKEAETVLVEVGSPPLQHRGNTALCMQGLLKVLG